MESSPDQFHPEALAEVLPGRDVSAGAYIQALNELTYVRRAIEDFFLQYDVLAVPATATTAFPVGEPPTVIGGKTVDGSWINFMPFPVAWNMGDNPTISIPCGPTPDGLPVGIMFVAARGREDLVLRAGRALELAQPWAKRQPHLPSAPGKDGARWE